MGYKYRCKICNRIITRDNQQKHLKKHNFTIADLKNSLIYKDNFERVN